jgi:predicted transglutaminase-like cysteine proteinase
MRPIRFLSAALLAGLFLSLTGVPGEANEFPRLFGTKEVRSTNLSPFVKWTGMLKRYFKHTDLETGDCSEPGLSKCHLDAWQRFLEQQHDADLMAQIEAVNRKMNSAPYITDIRNWGIDDYWATPLQFLDRDGDCEDYAISKYMSLRALGVPVESMRVAVVQDLNLDTAHAVLVVYVRGKGYVLDNQIEQVVAQADIYHYRPYYTVNENAWWLHKS